MLATFPGANLCGHCLKVVVTFKWHNTFLASECLLQTKIKTLAAYLAISVSNVASAPASTREWLLCGHISLHQGHWLTNRRYRFSRADVGSFSRIPVPELIRTKKLDVPRRLVEAHRQADKSANDRCCLLACATAINARIRVFLLE